MTTGKLAWITHIEGAEAIVPDLSNLDAMFARGLRSIGPVWSRPNHFGEGVPFRFPSSPDTGGGLTDAVQRWYWPATASASWSIFRTSQEKGFWDVAKLSDAPLVATHSNAHALSASFAQTSPMNSCCDWRVAGHGGPQLRHRLPAPRRPLGFDDGPE